MSNRSPVATRLLLVVCVLAFAMPGAAQTAEVSGEPGPAHLAYVEGVASIARDGRAEDASVNLPVLSGDQLRTRDGRAEVIYGDGSVLDIDHFTTVDFLSDELLRLLDGRVRLTIGGREGRDRVFYRVDTPAGSVRIDTPGEYRISLIGESGRARDVELITFRGFATLVNDLGETQVRAGERAFASASMAPSYAQGFNSATWDAFDQWAVNRRDERTGTASAQYLPEEVRGYSGSFDRHGDWRYDVTYGYVWYPRVAVGWRPYYHGRWNYYGPWGWTWIAYDPWWGWPTHHYGRWGFSAGVWFWIPTGHWRPHHVYWASAPGYVGWCPLGWNGRPVFAINIGGGGYGHGYSPYHGWTVVPRHRFASHRDVREYAVPRNTIEHAVPRWSVASAVAPVRPNAVARNTTPIYSAGRSYAVRRGADPAASSLGAFPATERHAPAGGGVEPAPRANRRTMPDQANVPRATPPPASGVLGAPSADASRARSRMGDPARTGHGVQDNAPRGVPERAPGYAPRGVPRTGDGDQRQAPQWQNPYEGRRANPDNVYQRQIPDRGGASERRTPGWQNPYEGRSPSGEDRPVRRNPEYARPAPSGPPPSASPDRPTYSRPGPAGSPPSRGEGPRSAPPAPREGGGSAPSRAVPRGGSSPPPSSAPPQQSGSSSHSRRRPG